MASGSSLVTLVAGVIGIGVVAQVLADRFQVPSIVFLLLAGVLLGPSGANLIGPRSFGDALGPIVGLSVAIIIFEGAF
ncbi:MAG: potassium transporter, partial [Haloferacaceae archaeon]